MEFTIQEADKCTPLCRKELFIDVVCKRVFGDVTQIFILPGHIFITTDHGRKLFTFDCKPVSYQHIFAIGCLDISPLSSPLAEILMISSDTSALIDIGGHVNFWKFGSDFNWSHISQIDLCLSNTSAELISVTYLNSLNIFFWCEKIHKQLSTSPPGVASSPDSYCICQRQILAAPDLHSENDHKELSSILLHNFAPCDLFALASDILFVNTRHDYDQTSVYLTFDFLNGQVSIFIGDECICLPVTPAMDFNEMLLNCLPQLVKIPPGKGDLGVKVDVHEGQVAVLNSGGQVELYKCYDLGKRKVTRMLFKLSGSCFDHPQLKSHQWFLHKGHLGVFDNDTLYIFKLDPVAKVSESRLGVFGVDLVIQSPSISILSWILTSDQLFALQGVDIKSKEMFTSLDNLPNDGSLQNDILKLARLQELKLAGYSYDVSQDLNRLNKTNSDEKHVQNQSQLASLMAPYLEEFWRLENLSKALVDSKTITIKPEIRSTDSMVQNLMGNRSISRPSRHALMLWLSMIYPQQLLDYLCQGVTVENAVVDPQEMTQWQSLLGLDGSDLMNFEFVCRLLFQLHPEKLLNFVKCAESVGEHNVGVSAFVRKKHSLIYYKSACDCLPESDMSVNPKMAARVKAKLILACEGNNCVETALKQFLQNELWSDAIELLRQEANNEEKLSSYMYITIRALSQSPEFSKFVRELFELMPSWKCFLTFSHVATERQEIRQQQLTASVRDIFANETFGVSLASVKPFLLDIIKDM
ncbi:unnamed protein product [Lymnaea stagnalis]|uniref:BLOC-2 complex member HPS6 N-terminal domain-containing protein n=1 Tax=Lymnaea stagnalis TaxID=6523 RepID=A0AAV2H835_LYMST